MVDAGVGYWNESKAEYQAGVHLSHSQQATGPCVHSQVGA